MVKARRHISIGEHATNLNVIHALRTLDGTPAEIFAQNARVGAGGLSALDADIVGAPILAGARGHASISAGIATVGQGVDSDGQGSNGDDLMERSWLSRVTCKAIGGAYLRELHYE